MAPQTSQIPDAYATVSMKDAMKLDKDDCTPCRLIGSAAFIGLGGYTYVSGMSQIERAKAEIARSNTMWGVGARRLGIHGIAVSMIGLGLYRYFI